MAAIPGTVVGSTIVPSDTADIYGTHDAQYGIGGRRSVTNKAAVTAIPALRRQVGMDVYVQNGETGMVYQLRDGVADVNFHQKGEVIDPLPAHVPYGSVTGMLTHSEALRFDLSAGFGDDPTLFVGGTGIGTNYTAIGIVNAAGTTNKLKTSSSDTMIIEAATSLYIDTNTHPGAFRFEHETNVDPVFTIDSSVGGASAQARIDLVHPENVSCKSYIQAGSSGALKINAYASMSLIINDSGCQYAIIEGTQVGGALGAKLGFFGITPQAKATISGAKGSNAALGSLLTALHNMGLITDSTSA